MAGLRRIVGKAVVFARRNVTIVESREWAALRIADVPHPGERIGRGHPICTVFAEGRDAEECHERLVRQADRVYRAVESVARGAA
jgi:predicted ATP-grasp superfamily ATP-dependent carboligase